MKDVLLGIFKRYFEVRMILKRTIVTERRGNITINIYDDVAPNLWQMYEQGSINISTGLGKLDFGKVREVQEEERQRLGRQAFEIILVVLKDLSEDKNKKKEWDAKYGKITPTITSNHIDLITYALGASFHLGILTPYEYDIMEPAFDETGKMLYVKNLPKPKTDEVTEALGHIMPQEKK